MPPLPDAWKEEFDRLRAERDRADARSAQLQETLGKLSDMVASQNDRLDQIVRMLRRREEQLKRLERENRKLRRELGLDDPEPPDTDAPPPKPPPPGTPATSPESPTSTPTGTKPSDGPPAESSASEPSPTKPKSRPRSYGGRRPPGLHLPEDTEYYPVSTCAVCGGRVLKRDVLVTTVYTVVPAYVRRRTIRRERVICADLKCHQPTTAPMPPMPCERALYDCRFLAWLVVLKFVLLVPLDRIRTLLETQGVVLAMGSLVRLIERAADLASSVDGAHMLQLRTGPWMCFDGTGLKALVLGQDQAWDGYLEVFTRDELTVFQFDLTKHADRLKERLNGFLGILVCDAESRNGAAAPDLDFANCNAHPLRSLRDAGRSQPILAAEGAKFIQQLYDLEDQAAVLGLTGDAKVAFRRQHCRPVLERFREWLERVVNGPLPPSDLVRKCAKYYLAHFADLTRFVDHADLPLDNNAAEREFQRHAKLRQACLFAGSEEGGHRWATLLGVVRTAQKCGVDVLTYLTWMFERRGSHRRHFGMTAKELTPMAYREAGCPGAVKALAA